MELLCIAPPEVEPVTLDETKADMRVDFDFTDHDDLIKSSITAAREQFEKMCNRAFIRQTWRIKARSFPLPFFPVELPRSRLIQVDEFKYLDTAGDWHTLVEDDDFQIEASEPPRLVADVWPVARNTPGAVQITFIVGYGDEPKDVPEGIKAAIRMYCKAQYESAFNDGASKEYERRIAAAHALLIPYRVMGFS
jgi:uncharacterized phiE125 gp8 family phage protein